MPRTIPGLANQQPGNFSTSALENTVGYAISFFGAVPVFSAFQTTTQSIPNTLTMTPLTLDTEVFDSDGGHSTVTNTSRYTPTVPGIYFVAGSVSWALSTTGTRRIEITKSGVTVPGSGASQDPTQAVVQGLQTTALVACNGTTDFIEVQAAHSASASLSTNSSAAFASSMQAFWMSS